VGASDDKTLITKLRNSDCPSEVTWDGEGGIRMKWGWRAMYYQEQELYPIKIFNTYNKPLCV
jgi:hypothetical protein